MHILLFLHLTNFQDQTRPLIVLYPKQIPFTEICSKSNLRKITFDLSDYERLRNKIIESNIEKIPFILIRNGKRTHALMYDNGTIFSISKDYKSDATFCDNTEIGVIKIEDPKEIIKAEKGNSIIKRLKKALTTDIRQTLHDFLLLISIISLILTLWDRL